MSASCSARHLHFTVHFSVVSTKELQLHANMDIVVSLVILVPLQREFNEERQHLQQLIQMNLHWLSCSSRLTAYSRTVRSETSDQNLSEHIGVVYNTYVAVYCIATWDSIILTILGSNLQGGQWSQQQVKHQAHKATLISLCRTVSLLHYCWSKGFDFRTSMLCNSRHYVEPSIFRLNVLKSIVRLGRPSWWHVCHVWKQAARYVGHMSDHMCVLTNAQTMLGLGWNLGFAPRQSFGIMVDSPCVWSWIETSVQRY